MNKYLIYIIVLLLIVVGYYLIKKNVGENKPTPQGPGEVSNEGNLKIIESKISYSVDKVFLKKPMEKIVGITSDINGDLNYDKNLISANLIVPTLNLKTGNDKRDEDVRKIIGEEIKIEVKEQELLFPYENKMAISITVGTQTNEVLFDVVANDTENVISISGFSKISMKSFGIDAPSMLEVYKASDEVELSFELKAKK